MRYERDGKGREGGGGGERGKGEGEREGKGKGRERGGGEKGEGERELAVSLCLSHRSKWQFVAGPFAQDLSVSPLLFLLSPNNKLLVSCGHWDNSFRVYSIEKGKLSARTEHHNGLSTPSVCVSVL